MTTAVCAAPLRKEELLSGYELMVLARATEDAVNRLFLQGKVTGTTHLAAGHEAIAVGSSLALKPKDYVFATYRGHHHAIARGVTPLECLAEILGRSGGVCGGRGGSMHITHAARGFLGCYGVVGAHLPLACGAALSSEIQADGRVTAVFFGDGSTNIGAFHESLNLAAVWRLPVIFVCENNFYAEYTPIGAVTPVEHPAADRASAYALPSTVVDGNDLEDVFSAVAAARGRAADGEGPSIIEALTYRHYGHSRADPAKYRPAGELEGWMSRDPLRKLRQRLIEEGLEEEVIESVRRRAEDSVASAVEGALDSLPPTTQQLLSQVWADGGVAWRR